nr:DUF4352 domain-containing protein [Anaeromonas gelatinilytica]
MSITLIGCDNSDSSDSSDTDTGSESSHSNDKEKETDSEEDSSQEKSILTLGKTIEMGDLSFVARSAQWKNGDEFSSPDEGEKWLAVDVEIINNSDESTSISSLLMFSLYDDENYSTEIAPFADTRGSLDGELGVGRSMAGEIAFEVPESSESFEFVFEPELFGFGQAIYSIQADEVQ